MLKFLPLNLEEINNIRQYFRLSSNRICDNTPGTALMWRDYFSNEYAVFDSTLIFKVKYFDGNTAFSFPMGKNIDGAIKEIEKYCDFNDLPMIFGVITENDIPKLSSIYDVEVFHEENWGDYLYKASDLAEMSGKKYSGQRNHINFFDKNNPGWYYEKMTLSNVPRVRRFYESLEIPEEKISDMFIEEQRKIVEVLENFEAYSMNGGFISLADGTVVAMAIGEVVKDTLFVHVEKARYDVRGAYQLIAREFPKSFMEQGIEYVNREEDLGQEGLRKSKLSYHPCEIIKKHTVRIVK